MVNLIVVVLILLAGAVWLFLPRIAAAAITTVVIFCGWQVFSAGMTATSLNGFYFAYIYLAHHDLGLPSGDRASGGPNLARDFCGGAGIKLQLTKPPSDRQCLPLPRAESSDGPCDPVAADGHVPDYVYPFSDHLTTSMAIVYDDVGKIAEHLRLSTKSDFLAAGTSEGRADVAGQKSKVVSLKQCTGYGYIEISQNLYDGMMPAWLRH